MSGLLTAGSGEAWESALVAGLEQPGSPFTVVRRCADLAEVLASAATGRAQIAVVDSSLRRLDTSSVERLLAANVAVVGVHPAGDDRARQRLELLGISALVADDAGADALIVSARAAMAELAGRPANHLGLSDPRGSLPPRVATTIGAPPGLPPTSGTVIAVWGPTGAPGRTTVAMGLADEASLLGHRALLVDADVYGGVLASAFGVLDESPGLAGACRLAAGGRLTVAELTKLTWSLSPTLRLLPGISRADRWPELRPSAIPRVLSLTSSLATLTVVDCAFSVEADEELSFDTTAPRRNGATLAVLGAADRVLVVGNADPPGMERLIRSIASLAEILPAVRPRVVLNRVRKTGWSASQAVDALLRFTGLQDPLVLPEDRLATDAGWNAGRPLSSAAPDSALRIALAVLAKQVVQQRVPVESGGWAVAPGT